MKIKDTRSINFHQMKNRKFVEVLIPTYNESAQILVTIDTVLRYCEKNLDDYRWKIIVGDNGSSDNTYGLVKSTFRENDLVEAVRIKEKGRGRAIMTVWGKSRADICLYMDADLSTDISHTREIVRAIDRDGYEIAIGSRLMSESKTTRNLKRHVVGRTNVLLTKLILGVSVSDFYCGFKGASRNAIAQIFPHINSGEWPVGGNAWFWDTEFLVNAKKLGFKIREIPVRWSEDSSSTVNLVGDTLEAIEGMLRLRLKKPWKRQFRK